MLFRSWDQWRADSIWRGPPGKGRAQYHFSRGKPWTSGGDAQATGWKGGRKGKNPASSSRASSRDSQGASGVGRGKGKTKSTRTISRDCQEASGSGRGSGGVRKFERKTSRWISVATARLLRHDKYQELGGSFPKMDRAGWVAADNIIACEELKEYKLTVEELVAVLEFNNQHKVRFKIESSTVGQETTIMVKAQQGHSQNVENLVDMDQVLERIVPGDARWADHAFHGTSERAWPSIVNYGMSTEYSRGATKRSHHHFVKEIDGDPDNEVEGVRHGSEIVVEVDLDQVHNAGAPIFISESGVFLTPGFEGRIPPQFIVQVFRRRPRHDGGRTVLYPPPRTEEGALDRILEYQEVALDDIVARVVEEQGRDRQNVNEEIGRAHV